MGPSDRKPQAPATVGESMATKQTATIAPAQPGAVTVQDVQVQDPVVVVPAPVLGPVRMTRAEVAAIRAARTELSNQLQSAASRREQLVGELHGTEGQVRAGLEQRLKVLDDRIAQLETDIATTGRQLTDASILPVSTSQPRTERFMDRVDPDAIAAAGFVLTLAFAIPLAIAWARMLWRRTSRAQQPAADAPSSERLERIEQAVDAIAIEVERISESQRFQTKLLAESQGLPIFAPSAREAERAS